MWLNLQITLDDNTMNTMSEDGSCGVVTRRQLERSSFCSDDYKRSPVLLKGEIGVTLSVAALGDTNPSDATATSSLYETNPIVVGKSTRSCSKLVSKRCLT